MLKPKSSKLTFMLTHATHLLYFTLDPAQTSTSSAQSVWLQLKPHKWLKGNKPAEEKLRQMHFSLHK